MRLSESSLLTLREWRHSPCLMTPLTSLLLLVMGLVGMITLVCHIPEFILGLLLGPFLKRGNWFVEFLYPASIIGWGHVSLAKWQQRKNAPSNASSSKNKGNIMAAHSRTIEQRIEVIPDEIYIHAIPLLMDNIGYLIVYLNNSNNSDDNDGDESDVITGMIVDASDADDIYDAIDHIQDVHYNSTKIEVTCILSTHKHHDHTAGNYALMNEYYKESCTRVYGGAIERVPCCTHQVKNGDFVDLPLGMSAFVDLLVIAVPSHTRGSVVYALRNKGNGTDEGVIHLFTGDAIFCAGGGVPFESDHQTPNSLKPTAGFNSVERCFAQILAKSGSTSTALIYPGHEYSTELLYRQFDPKNDHGKHWHHLSPSFFFETAHQYFLSSHRRALTRGTKLLNVPTPMSRELKINPHFRALRRRGEHLINALNIWKQMLNQEELTHIQQSSSQSQPNTTSISSQLNIDSNNQRSTPFKWTLTKTDINRKVFTTVYTSDLTSIIHDLSTNQITNQTASQRLIQMTTRLDEPLITRKPAPNTLPTQKSVRYGVLSLILLASPPSAMTVSDALAMNLPRPTSDGDGLDHIKISKQRLLTVLFRLGLIDSMETGMLVHIIDLLWEKAIQSSHDLALDVNDDDPTHHVETATDISYGATAESSLENGHSTNSTNLINNNKNKDKVQLGLLKIHLYEACHQSLGWPGYCKPINTKTPKTSNNNMKQSDAELVRHNFLSCPVCKDVVGCPQEKPIVDIKRCVPCPTTTSATTTTSLTGIISNAFSPLLRPKHDRPNIIERSDSVEMEAREVVNDDDDDSIY